jgi:hypothetical protein
MAVTFPTSPTVNQEFFAANKAWEWTGATWIRSYKYAIIDGGFSGTNVTSGALTADGGDA